jgi:hypothetical protein
MPNINLKEILDQFRGEHAEGISTLRDVVDILNKPGITGAERTAQAKFGQQAVSTGLAGSTRPAAVSAGLSAQFEDMRFGRLIDAMNNLAGIFATPGTIAHTATGGFGAQLSKEQQRFEQEQASFPSIISGNQQGLGYQPPTNFGGTGSNPFSPPPGSAFGSRRNVAGSVQDSESTWGNAQTRISEEEANRPRQTIAGMHTDSNLPTPYTPAEIEAINDWVASEQAGTYSGVPSGPVTA